MKDIHDRSTQDMQTLDASFSALGVLQEETDRKTAKFRAEIARVEAYYREKPYLREALRRTVK